jgi:hypothetical protein
MMEYLLTANGVFMYCTEFFRLISTFHQGLMSSGNTEGLRYEKLLYPSSVDKEAADLYHQLSNETEQAIKDVPFITTVSRFNEIVQHYGL